MRMRPMISISWRDVNTGNIVRARYVHTKTEAMDIARQEIRRNYRFARVKYPEVAKMDAIIADDMNRFKPLTISFDNVVYRSKKFGYLKTNH